MLRRGLHLGLVLLAVVGAGCSHDDTHAPTAPPLPEAPSYAFEGPLPRDVLVSYLARAMTMGELCLGYEWPVRAWTANLELIRRLEPKFLGRVAYVWGYEDEYLADLTRLTARVDRVHAVDPEIILQACIFECVSRHVERVPVPVRVQAAFGLEPVPRWYDLDAMKPLTGPVTAQPGLPVEAIVPDLTRLETQLWFYHLATLYVDAGIEALHLGRLEAVASRDENLATTDQLIGRIRAYARAHARRGWVLLDAHTHGLVRGKRLLLDFHSWPLRPREVTGTGEQDVVLDPGFLDAIYTHSRGGVTPSGWYAHSLPYLVELDNGYAGAEPGECELPECVWGCDEITWFALQSPERRDALLEQLFREIRTLDPVGFLQVPGMRVLQAGADAGSPFYFVHDPRSFPAGGGQEDVVASIWAAGTGEAAPWRPR